MLVLPGSRWRLFATAGSQNGTSLNGGDDEPKRATETRFPDEFRDPGSTPVGGSRV